jgi:hypothetical protein
MRLWLCVYRTAPSGVSQNSRCRSRNVIPMRRGQVRASDVERVGSGGHKPSICNEVELNGSVARRANEAVEQK